MTFKMAVFDVDGTLYDLEEHIVSESSKEALIALKRNGIILTIATGRTHYDLGKTINSIHADYILAANGGVVVDKNKTILSHCDMTLQECESLIDFAHKTNAGLVFKSPEHMYIYQYPEKIDWLEGQMNSDIGKDPFIFPTEQTHHLKELPQSACIHADPALVEEFAKTSTLSFKQYSADGYDVAPHGINKGTGIKSLMQILNLTPEEVVSFGDNYNDKEMMESTGYRIAMGNAVEDIKKMADFVTKSVTEDGIEYALKQLKMI